MVEEKFRKFEWPEEARGNLFEEAREHIKYKKDGPSEEKFRNLERLKKPRENSFEEAREHIRYKKDGPSAVQQGFFLQKTLQSNKSPKSGMFNVCVKSAAGEKEIK